MSPKTIGPKEAQLAQLRAMREAKRQATKPVTPASLRDAVAKVKLKPKKAKRK